MSRVLAGPFAGRMLSDLGADVVKVEPPEGDVTRNWGRVHAGQAGYYVQQNVGKRNICVDLGAEGGPDLIKRLVPEVDVLIENVFAHTPAGCGYRLYVRTRVDGRHSFTVSDDGQGFDDLGVARRGASRAGSTGLGLDIVVRTAERTGGGVRLGSSRDGGAEVTVVVGRSDRGSRVEEVPEFAEPSGID